MDLPETKIVDVINTSGYEKYHYQCLTAITKKRFKKRTQYLVKAVPKGLRRDLLFINGDAVGMMEYAPVEAVAYPILGKKIWVINCIWVLRRAAGHKYGLTLVDRMKKIIKHADGIATIALEGHYSPWFKLHQIEYLGFKSIDSRKMRHKTKHREVYFGVHLMWMPLSSETELPTMDWEKIYKGIDFCIAHPLYRATSLGLKEPFEPC